MSEEQKDSDFDIREAMKRYVESFAIAFGFTTPDEPEKDDAQEVNHE